MSNYKQVCIPEGDMIEADAEGILQTPNHPIIGFIEGDGTGPDIWRAAKRPIICAARTFPMKRLKPYANFAWRSKAL